MRSDLGSPALAKVREAVLGPNGNNLDDLVRLDGITLKTFDLNGFLYFYISAFLHTGDLEAVNALLLKYLPKKIAFRFVKIKRITPMYSITKGSPPEIVSRFKWRQFWGDFPKIRY